MPSVAPYTAGASSESSRTNGGSWGFGPTFSVSGLGPFTGSTPPYPVTNLLTFSAWGPSPNVLPYVPPAATNIVVNYAFLRNAGVGSTATIRDDTVQPLHNGTPVGANLAATGTNWPSTNTLATYAATGYTAAQINSGLIGLQIGATAYGTSGDTAAATIGTPYIDSITWDIPDKIGTCGGDVGDEDGHGTDNHVTFDDSGDTMQVGASAGVQSAAFARIHIGTDPTQRIPWSARIITAALTFTDHGGSAVPVSVCATNSAQSSAPVDATDLWDGRILSLSAAQIPWTIPSSSPSEPYPTIDTPDLSELIQELIRRIDYEQDNSHFLFILVPVSASALHTLGTHEANEGCYLTVTWTTETDLPDPDDGEQLIQTSTFFLFIE